MTPEEIDARRRKCHRKSQKYREARIRRNGGAAYAAFRASENAKKRRQRASKAAREGRPYAQDSVLLEREAQHVYQPREFRVLMRS